LLILQFDILPFIIGAQAPARAEYVRKEKMHMTDNEKRAHDFAVAMLPEVINGRVNERARSGENEIVVDMYTEYIALYNKVLKSFNRDFPDGQ